LNTKLVWITPDAEKHIAYCARVSNPTNQENPDYRGLLSYCKKHGHWSVFEMASACFEIEAPRDISRQILRHRSFSFQEFSQRYADVTQLPKTEFRECRLQDTNNRQNSIESQDESLQAWWLAIQDTHNQVAQHLYNQALEAGVAKEQARVLLPEGLTPSRLYMSGTIRSWLHYCDVRTGNGTQKEHIEIAKQIKKQLAEHLPIIFGEPDE
jgi:thymidylate synthase (FAD)